MYSDDLRERVVTFCRSVAAGVAVSEVAAFFKSQRQRYAVGWLASCRRKKRRRKIDGARDCVAAIYAAQPFATHKEVQALILSRTGLHISVGSIFTLRKELGITRKRVVERKICSRLEQVEAKRAAAFRANIEALVFKAAVSVDECHFKLHAAPRYGYARKGVRLLRQIASASNKIYSLLMAMAREGVLRYEIHQGAINGPIFRSFLERLNLRQRPVLMDNVSFHRSRLVRELLAERGVTPLFTPPYTPEYNPIELAFAQIKAHYRSSSAAHGRSGRMCRSDIDRSIQRVSATEAEHYFDFVWNEVTGEQPKYPDLRGLVRRYVLLEGQRGE